MPAILPLWKKMSALPGGKIVFSRMVCLKAPYFASIRPLITKLDRETCEVRISKRRAVTNHLALCMRLPCAIWPNCPEAC